MIRGSETTQSVEDGIPTRIAGTSQELLLSARSQTRRTAFIYDHDVMYI